jgi:Holliday junction resolvase RusA-like endonuclease
MQSNHKLLYEFRLNAKPMSVNEAYVNNYRGGSAKSGAYIRYQYDIEMQLNALFTESPNIGERIPLKIDYDFYFPIYKKDTTILSKTAGDVTNCIKAIEDILAKYFNFNDSQVVTSTQTKIQSLEKYMIIKIYTIEL